MASDAFGDGRSLAAGRDAGVCGRSRRISWDVKGERMVISHETIVNIRKIVYGRLPDCRVVNWGYLFASILGF